MVWLASPSSLKTDWRLNGQSKERKTMEARKKTATANAAHFVRLRRPTCRACIVACCIFGYSPRTAAWMPTISVRQYELKSRKRYSLLGLSFFHRRLRGRERIDSFGDCEKDWTPGRRWILNSIKFAPGETSRRRRPRCLERRHRCYGRGYGREENSGERVGVLWRKKHAFGMTVLISPPA